MVFGFLRSNLLGWADSSLEKLHAIDTCNFCIWSTGAGDMLSVKALFSFSYTKRSNGLITKKFSSILEIFVIDHFWLSVGL